MVAGGGASVVYADSVCDLGFTQDLANYGEYSGAPTTTQTYEYAKTILSLMTRKVLGGTRDVCACLCVCMCVPKGGKVYVHVYVRACCELWRVPPRRTKTPRPSSPSWPAR